MRDDVPTAEELTGVALQRLLRGGTWEALANEIAWKAVRLTDAGPACLEWLPGLVEETLAERIDGVEFVLDRARDAARREHLHEWPHDRTGAETAATLAADEEAARQLAGVYLDVLDWAGDLLERRLARQPVTLRSRLPSLRRSPPPPEVELPPPVADALRPARRYGWPTREAA
jgi:hypothetical protein